MEALNALRILTAPHILSANMKNVNVELVSSEMEEPASLVGRLIPINNLRNSKKRYVSFLGNKFSLAEKSWHNYYYFRIKLFMLLQIRVSQPLAKLSVPLKLNPVGLGWKQDTGGWPAGNPCSRDDATFFSLVFFFFFLIFLFDRQNAYWKAFFGIFRSPRGQKTQNTAFNSGLTANLWTELKSVFAPLAEKTTS